MFVIQFLNGMIVRVIVNLTHFICLNRIKKRALLFRHQLSLKNDFFIVALCVDKAIFDSFSDFNYQWKSAIDFTIFMWSNAVLQWNCDSDV